VLLVERIESRLSRLLIRCNDGRPRRCFALSLNLQSYPANVSTSSEGNANRLDGQRKEGSKGIGGGDCGCRNKAGA
jgi:hypothetical protein